MGMTHDALVAGRAQALAQSDEPTAEMIAESAAEVAEPTFTTLGASEELTGGAGAMYLREIANHDLLSAEDERRLAQRMEAGRAAAARLMSGEILSETERLALERQRGGGEAGRRPLVEC